MIANELDTLNKLMCVCVSKRVSNYNEICILFIEAVYPNVCITLTNILGYPQRVYIFTFDSSKFWFNS